MTIYELFADIEGPFLTANKQSPFIAGVEVEINCTVSTSDMTIEITWDCMDLSNHPRVYHAKTDYMSAITFVPSSNLNGINCKCLIEVDDFVVFANITLEVIS